MFDEKQNYSVNMIDFMFKTGKSWMSILLDVWFPLLKSKTQMFQQGSAEPR